MVLWQPLWVLFLGGGLTTPAAQSHQQCGNHTADLACQVFLRGNLCDDKDLLGGAAAATLGDCFAACHTDSSCKYFGLKTTPHSWCIRYKNCTPRADPAGSVTYTTYAMTSRVGPVPPPPPPPPLVEETFWQITDIHLNPEYPKGCGSCAAAYLNKTGCGTFADYFCGSSPALYTAAVKFMGQQNAHEAIRPPSFVAHTGDMPDIPGGNATAIRAMAKWQADILYQNFPTTPVFFAFGNHDFDGEDCPYLPGCAEHYASICASFGRDLDTQAHASCAATGYYYVDNRVAGVRIVVLNTEYFGWEQGCDLSNHTHAEAADTHLRWLAQTLAGAPNSKIMILGHIPPASAYGMYEEGFTGGAQGYTEPGVQLWWQSHIERYNAIIGSASERVTFEIWGHLHLDTFFVPRGGAASGRWKPPTGGARRQPTSVLWVGPSLAAWYPRTYRSSVSCGAAQAVDSLLLYRLTFCHVSHTALGMLQPRTVGCVATPLATTRSSTSIPPSTITTSSRARRRGSWSF